MADKVITPPSQILERGNRDMEGAGLSYTYNIRVRLVVQPARALVRVRVLLPIDAWDGSTNPVVLTKGAGDQTAGGAMGENPDSWKEEAPLQIVSDGPAFTTGEAFTVTFTDAAPVQEPS